MKAHTTLRFETTHWFTSEEQRLLKQVFLRVLGQYAPGKLDSDELDVVCKLIINRQDEGV